MYFCFHSFFVMMSKTVDYAILFSNCFILKVIYSQTPDNHIHVLLVITSQSLLLGYVWPSRHIGSLSFGGMFFRQIWMFVKSPDARCLSSNGYINTHLPKRALCFPVSYLVGSPCLLWHEGWSYPVYPCIETNRYYTKLAGF